MPLSEKLRSRLRRWFKRERPSSNGFNYSYENLMRFPRLPITVPPLVPTLMSYRWHDDDDFDVLPRKFSRDGNFQHGVRRRLPKRFSDLVVPSKGSPRRGPSTRSESLMYEKIDSNPGSSRHFDRKPTSNLKNQRLPSSDSIDVLAQRMQAAMSSELLHSLDRNFVLSEKKLVAINRSQSFNPSALTKTKSFQMIPRVRSDFLDEISASIDDLTPDYDQEILVEHLSEESDDETMKSHDENQQESSGASSVVIPLSCTTPSTESNDFSIPPTPPPLAPIIDSPDRPMTKIRCRTIADRISSDHKLILRDSTEPKTNLYEKKTDLSRSTSSISTKSTYFQVSKELLTKTSLRKVSYPTSRSFSSYGSMSKINERETELTTICERTSVIDETGIDLSLSEASGSIILDNNFQVRSSSKIYNDYKRRASLINVSSNNDSTITRTHSTAIIHPMHTHIELRSNSINSNPNKSYSDNHLTNKQVNLCVINQLNAHLSTRFRQQHKEFSISTLKTTFDERNYDEPPEDNSNNVYDEPDNERTPSTYQSDVSTPSTPPVPPPLPVGGFRTSANYVPAMSICPRASTLTLPRDCNGSEPGSNGGNSTVSSKLSDSRILRELRSNPLFAKAREHFELKQDTENRRATISTAELPKEDVNHYSRLNSCTKANPEHLTTCKSNASNNIETLIIKPNELNSVLGPAAKRSKSMSSVKKPDLTSIKPRSFAQTQPNKSELELVFQKRAQRSEQNLT